MKSYLLRSVCILFTSINFCLALYTVEQQIGCLHDNGLNNSTDLDLFRSFLHSDSKDQKEFPLEEKFSCAVACVVNSIKKTPQDSVYQKLMDIIEKDDQNQSGLKKDMKTRMEQCRQQAGGDDCKLLYCLKIFRSPFKELLLQHLG